MKRDRLDKLFSDLVRCRSNWTCERCGKKFDPDIPRGTQGLDCSHYWGRRGKSTRWLPLNCSALCQGCHSYLDDNPHDHTEWKRQQVGEENYQRLVEYNRVITHWKKHDLEEIKRQLKAQWTVMKSMRDKGYEGRIEFSIPFVEDW